MQLGFMSAALPDLSLEEVFAFAADEGFACVEVMCWPPGAGVCHLDVTAFGPEPAAHVLDLVRIHQVGVSGLGYYPNPLHPDPSHRHTVCDHLRKVIRAAPLVGVKVVNTFVGQNPARTVADNLADANAVWPAILAEAAAAGVRVGIEHCPMLPGGGGPGGGNVATSPAVWRALFNQFPGAPLGLNLDPSHLVWQGIDAGRVAREFGPRVVHVHAKDERVDRDALYEVGVLGSGWHKPKLPGLGDVDWGGFFAALTDVGYRGAVCVEVEDAAYEGSAADRRRALRQSKRFLEQFFG